MIERIDVRFRAGEATLAGTLTLPPGEGRRPWALLLGSWLPRDRDGGWDRTGHPDWFAAPVGEVGLVARLAEALAQRGVASLRYDPRGCGMSDGAWEEVDLFTRIDDARDAVGAMRSRHELDLRRTAIIGHGEGGTLALSVAIGDPAVGAVGLIGAAARSPRDVMRRGAAERARTGRDREHPIVAVLDRFSEELIERVARREHRMTIGVAGRAVTLRLAGWEEAFHTPALALATMLHRHVVLAHGDADAWADPEETRLLAAALGVNADDGPETQHIDAAGHDLAEADDAAISRFVDAIVDGMRPRDLPPVLLAIEEMGS